MGRDHPAVAQDQPCLPAIKGHRLPLPQDLVAARIAVQQRLDNPAADEMLPDDGAGIIGGELLVEDPFGVDDDGGAEAAIANAAHDLHGDLRGDPPSSQLVVERLLHLTAALRAAGDPAADEQAVLRLRPHPLPG